MAPVRTPARTLLLLATLAWAAAAGAVEIGHLHWRTPPGQPAYADIALLDPQPVPTATLRARLASRESYDVVGLIYDPRLADLRITPQQRADGSTWLRLDGVPGDAASVDLLITVNDRAELALAEFHLDLRRGPFELPPSAPGSRLLTRPASPESAELATARAAVSAWGQAWSQRNLDAYVAAYVPDYAGRGDLASRAAWLAQRRERLGSRRRIEVEIAGLQLKRQGPLVSASFEQRYRADGLDQRSRKTLLLERVEGRWLIRREVEGR